MQPMLNYKGYADYAANIVQPYNFIQEYAYQWSYEMPITELGHKYLDSH